jgi:CheY-like chemotaxis protein
MSVSREPAAGLVKLLAVADVHDELTSLVDLLRTVVGPFEETTDEEHALAVVGRQEPLVLALAHSRLELALIFYLRALKRLAGDRSTSMQTLVFCDRNEAQRAYSLCCDGVIDDYLVTRPIYDPYQLALSVKQARDRLAIKRWMVDITTRTPERRDITQCIADLETATAGLAPRNERLERAVTDVRMAVADLSTQLEEGTRIVEQSRAAEHLVDGALKLVASALPRPPAAPATSGMATILLVDDDEVARRFVRRILESAGYRVLTAEDGRKGLAVLRAEPVDLVLMDVEMPGMSGIETTKRLRERWAADALPVIMLTGHAEQETVVDALQAGASDFILKPYTRDALLAKLHERLPARSAGPQ